MAERQGDDREGLAVGLLLTGVGFLIAGIASYFTFAHVEPGQSVRANVILILLYRIGGKTLAIWGILGPGIAFTGIGGFMLWRALKDDAKPS